MDDVMVQSLLWPGHMQLTENLVHNDPPLISGLFGSVAAVPSYLESVATARNQGQTMKGWHSAARYGNLHVVHSLLN